MQAQRIRAVNKSEVVDLGEIASLDKGRILRRSKLVLVGPGDYQFQALDPAGQAVVGAGRLISYNRGAAKHAAAVGGGKKPRSAD